MIDFNSKKHCIVEKNDIKFVDFTINQLKLNDGKIIKFIPVNYNGEMKFAYLKYLYPNL